MKQDLVIFGAGGFGREVLQVVRDLNAVAPVWNCLGFLADAAPDAVEAVAGLPVLGGIEWLRAHPEVQVVIAVGSSAARWKIAQRIVATCGNRFAVLVHPRAWVGERVEIGPGSVVCAGALLTTDIRLGRHVHVNIGSTIGHDAVLDDFATLNPSVNVSGNVRIMTGGEIGTGSVVIPRCTVGAWAIVGAGAVVTSTLAANVTAVGAPARVIKERADGWQA
jgi:sugar O-acyltransferase (sialic acid O-acetyltransferase NeuD family)